jgi:hypothetical protein
MLLGVTTIYLVDVTYDSKYYRSLEVFMRILLK